MRKLTSNQVRVRRYRPAFFDGYESKEHIVESIEVLLAVDWVIERASRDEFRCFRVEVSEACGIPSILLSVEEGKASWVLANLDGPGAKALACGSLG